LLALLDYEKVNQPVFINFVEKMAHGPWKKPLDFGGSPDNVMLC